MFAGSEQAVSHQWRRVPVMVGLGLLLLAFSGCTQASPSASASPEPGEGEGTGTVTPVTPTDAPGPPPPVDVGPTPETGPGGADDPAFTVEAVYGTITAGDQLQFKLRLNPKPSTIPVTSVPVSLSWTGRTSILVNPPSSATIDGNGETTVTVSTNLAPDASLGTNDHAVVYLDGSLVSSSHRDRWPNVSGRVGVVVFEPDLSVSVVNVRALDPRVTEGQAARFEVTADPPPESELTVGLDWYGTLHGDVGEGPARVSASLPNSVTIPANAGMVSVSVPTIDDIYDNISYPLDGTLGLSLKAGPGLLLGLRLVAVVSVVDDEDAHDVSVVAAAASLIKGQSAKFALTMTPAPSDAITVNLSWTTKGDRITGSRPTSVAIPTSGTRTLTVTTSTGTSVKSEDSTVTIQVDPGQGYSPAPSRVGPTEATVTVQELYDVSVAAIDGWVWEGNPARFRLTMTPAPSVAMTVNLSWSTEGDRIGSRPTSVSIPTTGTAEVSVPTTDDSIENEYSEVTIQVGTGNGYRRASSWSASVVVADNDRR